MTLAWTPLARPRVEQANNALSESVVSSGEQVGWMPIGALEIEIRLEFGQFVAVEHRTGMFGEGDDAGEALADLLASLYEHEQDLAAHRPKLSQHLQDQLEALARSLPR